MALRFRESGVTDTEQVGEEGANANQDACFYVPYPESRRNTEDTVELHIPHG